MPLGPGRLPEQSFLVEGNGRPHSLPVNVIGVGYFSTMRVPLLTGRDFRRWNRSARTS